MNNKFNFIKAMQFYEIQQKFNFKQNQIEIESVIEKSTKKGISNEITKYFTEFKSTHKWN